MTLPDLGPRYRILRELGRGGMGIVYLAEDRLYGRTVALKMLPPNVHDPSVVRRFQREAGNLARLEHENIVRFHGVGEHGGRVFFSMEFVDGPPVHVHLREQPDPISCALELAAQVASALEHAHSRDVVHRDLKPENVLLDATGRVRVMDFGLARRISDTRRLTSTGAILGTAAYLSPEQAMGDRAEPRSDLYALGIVLYEWLCDRVPFDETDPLAVVMAHLQDPPPPPRTYNPDIPEEVEEFLLRLLEKDRARRPSSATEVLRRLAELSGGGRPAAPVRLESDRPSMVGRGEELEAILEAVEGAHRGRGGLVRIVGGPGTGKSRLLDEVEVRLRPRRLVLVRARGRGGDGAALWSAVLTALGRSFADPTAEFRNAVAEARRALEEGCARFEDPRGRRVWLACLCRPLACVPRGRRVVLLLDDVDQADSMVDAVLRFLVAGLPASGAAVVAAMRPGERPSEPADRCVPPERLAGLPPGVCLTVELGPLQPEVGSSGEPATPADPDARALLSTAAALGEPMELRPLSALLRKAPSEVRRALDRACAEGWLEEDEAAGWRFTSPTRRERALDLLEGSPPAGFHAEAMRALRTAPRPWPPAMARHAAAAGLEEEAALWTLEGARLRRRRLALEEACADLQGVFSGSASSSLGLERSRTLLAAGRAEEAARVARGALESYVPAAERGPLQRLLAEALEARGQREEALAAARAAAAASGSAPERARALLLVGRLCTGEEALKATVEAVEEADRSGDVVVEMDARLDLASLRLRRGEGQHAPRLAQAALRLAGESRQPDLRVAAGLCRAAVALEVEVDPDRCLALCRSAQADAEDLKDGPWLSQLYTLQGRASSARGEWGAAEEAFARALEVQQEYGLVTEMDFSCSQLGEIALIQGDPDQARRYLERSLQLAEAEGDPETFFLSKCGLGQLLLDRGEAEPARALFGEALESARRSGDLRGEARAHNLLSAAAVQEGRGEAAAEAAREALRLAEGAGDALQAGLAHARLGAALRLEGNDEGARDQLELALADLLRAAAPYHQALVRTDLGELLTFGPGGGLRHEPDLGAGLLHLDEAARLFSQMGAFAALARVDRLQSRILAARTGRSAAEAMTLPRLDGAALEAEIP